MRFWCLIIICILFCNSCGTFYNYLEYNEYHKNDAKKESIEYIVFENNEIAIYFSPLRKDNFIVPCLFDNRYLFSIPFYSRISGKRLTPESTNTIILSKLNVSLSYKNNNNYIGSKFSKLSSSYYTGDIYTEITNPINKPLNLFEKNTISSKQVKVEFPRLKYYPSKVFVTLDSKIIISNKIISINKEFELFRYKENFSCIMPK